MRTWRNSSAWVCRTTSVNWPRRAFWKNVWQKLFWTPRGQQGDIEVGELWKESTTVLERSWVLGQEAKVRNKLSLEQGRSELNQDPQVNQLGTLQSCGIRLEFQAAGLPSASGRTACAPFRAFDVSWQREGPSATLGT